VKRDLRAALDWYAAAARQGDDAAREQARLIADRLARERDS
jgi:TPR repeat protein